MSDALVALLVIGALALPLWWAGLTWWVWLVLGLTMAVGVVEGLAVWRTGRTLSQQFWAFRQRHPKAAWGLIGLLALVWLGLLVHLTWR